jgi:hypothetical protein
MIDAVLSYHADGISCGVTRFSQQLAKRLDVGWHQCSGEPSYVRPLVSLKFGEMTRQGEYIVRYGLFDLFLHDVPRNGWARAFAMEPGRLFAASAAIADELRPLRPDVIPAWCPSLVEAQPREPITVLSFGMAHKLRTDLYATLKEKLDATGENYVVYVSAALHEGTSFLDASHSFTVLRQMFGPRFVFLGTLSDEAMVDRLRTSTYVAAFFEQGLRENNTSVMAAIEHGARVLTNHDTHTPGYLVALSTDITLETLPHVAQRECLHERYSWDKLVELIKHA